MRLLLLSTLLLLSALPAHAQRVVLPGTQVRITVGGRTPAVVQGTLVASRDDVVEINSLRGTQYVPASAITGIAVRGPRDRRRGAFRGALIGTIAGISLTTLTSPYRRPEDGVPEPRASVAQWLFYGTAAGAAAGGGIGAAFGVRKWEEIGAPVASREVAGVTLVAGLRMAR